MRATSSSWFQVTVGAAAKSPEALMLSLKVSIAPSMPVVRSASTTICTGANTPGGKLSTSNT